MTDQRVVDFDRLADLLTSGTSGAYETAVVELARAQAVLTWHTTNRPATTVPVAEPEELIGMDQALACAPGATSRWLKRQTRGLKFRRDLNRKKPLFEKAGLLRWLASKARR